MRRENTPDLIPAWYHGVMKSLVLAVVIGVLAAIVFVFLLALYWHPVVGG